jgi:Domain of unknown function (DUF3883)
MTRYWCVDFGHDAVLTHGIEKKPWMMQYQYADEQNNGFEGDRPAQITMNWRRLKEINVGDRFAAYLPRNTFYATGTVITPRRAKTSKDYADTVDEYLKRKRSHDHTNGCVYYTPVFYEDFSDKWRPPADKLNRWPQRIDVDEWRHFVPDGVVVKGLNRIPPYELQKAAFEISKDLFDDIAKRLAAENVDDSVVEAIERQQAKGHGFQLDSTLRKALENYAMDVAKEYFANKGYECDDHSTNCPYDLLCSREREVLYVEVKGTLTDGAEIILTRGEVEFARRHQGQMVLVILHSIEVSNLNKGIILGGGKRTLIRPWSVDQGDLMAVSYKYRLPS